MSSFRRRDLVTAERLCREALARNPHHLRSLVLLGDIVQQRGRNKLAVKLLGQALELDAGDAAAHDTIAIAHQQLGNFDDAVHHFMQAIALGLADVSALVKGSATVAPPLRRLAEAGPKRLPLFDLLGGEGASTFASDPLLTALLRSRAIRDFELERLLTVVRRGLLQCAIDGDSDAAANDGPAFFCALAEQCFINEYVFALDTGESDQVARVRGRLLGELEAGGAIAPLDLAVVASYLPLHTLPGAAALLDGTWPECIARLLIQQIREPLDEAADRAAIPVLTEVDDAVSLQVQNQYEENPYPRWITATPVKPEKIADHLREILGITPEGWPKPSIDVLIAGCGTGAHSIDTALKLPHAQVLAVDISRASLAYARRKTRTLALGNIEYGQADILKLASLGRQFDLIEAVGVLHHLSDPVLGWRLLLSLLRPNGLMLVGLYSALARRSVVAARAYIAEQGYQATAEDIRRCRQDLIRRGRVPPFNDFASMSGCRDLLFNVMEHRFTIPEIKAFIDENRLTFLGFDKLPSDVVAQFRAQSGDAAAMPDLDAWHRFEQAHPMTFGNMYFFWVQKHAVSDEAAG